MVKNTHRILDGSFLSGTNTSGLLKFFVFLVLLGLLYIANNHHAEKKIREIEKTKLRISGLKSDYDYQKSKLTKETRVSVLADRLKEYGLKPLVEPPEKIFIPPKKQQP